jgi:hypothetical protein
MCSWVCAFSHDSGCLLSQRNYARKSLDISFEAARLIGIENVLVIVSEPVNTVKMLCDITKGEAIPVTGREGP